MQEWRERLEPRVSSDLSLVQEKSFAHLIADIAMHLLNRNASIIYICIYFYMRRYSRDIINAVNINSIFIL